MDFHNAHADMHSIMYNLHVNLIRDVCADLDRPDAADELINTYVTKTFIKIKPMRDPTKPKRALSAYMLFCNDHRGRIMEADKSLRLGDVSKALAVEWRDLTVDERRPYILKAEDEKDAYEDKIVDWKTSKKIT